MLRTDMAFLDRMERKFGWLSFPGFLRYYGIFHALVYLLQLVNPRIGELLDFDQQKIMSGEVWRMITFLVAPAGYGWSLTGMIFLIFGVMLMFMFSDGLEGAWGEFRTSIFCYMGIFCAIGGNILLGGDIPRAGYYIYASVFFSFATLYPKVKLNLYMIIPVEIRFLAILTALILIISALANPILGIFIPLVLTNYVVFAGIPALRGKATERASLVRRKEFKAAKVPESGAFHTCATCGRTEVSNPELDFRMESDGQEYCEDHLPK